MHILGILVRTDIDPFTSLLHEKCNDILETSRRHGHIFIDLSRETATVENLFRIMSSIGTPQGDFLKIVLFYCHTMGASPLDQTGDAFITEETIRFFKDWGVYCIGCNVGRELAGKLTDAGATFVIALNCEVGAVQGHESEILRGLNIGVLKILEGDTTPNKAADYMRFYFREEAARLALDLQPMHLMRALMLTQLADAVEIKTHNLLAELRSLRPGKKDAIAYQGLVARILECLFHPDLSQPDLEVSNVSGSSRYDIVFSNRAREGFWHDLKMSWRNNVVIFDAKNKIRLSPSDCDQMLRYSSGWRGNLLFIVSRRTSSKAFERRACEMLKEKEVCLLTVCDSDLENMFLLKEQGNDPVQVVEDKFRNRIERA